MSPLLLASSEKSNMYLFSEDAKLLYELDSISWCVDTPCRARAPDAPDVNEQCEAVDGLSDRQWLGPFDWTQELRKLNKDFFGNKSFR